MTTPGARNQPRILDLAIAAAAIVMFLGILGGVLAMVRQDFSAAGLCLLAAAVAAGLAMNAVLRA